MRFLAAYLSLFTSVSTLICCAIPSLLIALGLGATVVGAVGLFPQLIWLTDHKASLFSIGFILLGIGSLGYCRSRNDPCPIDPQEAYACKVARKWSFRALIFSWTMYAIGFTFAYILPLILL